MARLTWWHGEDQSELIKFDVAVNPYLSETSLLMKNPRGRSSPVEDSRLIRYLASAAAEERSGSR